MKPPIVFLFLVSIVGCSTPTSLAPSELDKYVLDFEHGLIQKTQINGYSIEVYNKPTDLWVLQEIKDIKFDNVVVDKLREKYGQYYYFILNLSRDNREALHANGADGQYSDLVQTLSFRMGAFVNLTTSKHDTISLGDFVLNRTYGMSDATSLLFVFDREKAKNSEWVQFNLNEFGLGVGNQRFRFDTKHLNQVPKIDFIYEYELNAQRSSVKNNENK